MMREKKFSFKIQIPSDVSNKTYLLFEQEPWLWLWPWPWRDRDRDRDRDREEFIFIASWFIKKQ